MCQIGTKSLSIHIRDLKLKHHLDVYDMLNVHVGRLFLVGGKWRF